MKLNKKKRTARFAFLPVKSMPLVARFKCLFTVESQLRLRRFSFQPGLPGFSAF